MSISNTHHTYIREKRLGSDFYRWNASLLREFSAEIFSPDLNRHHTLNRLGRGAAVMFRHGELDLVLRHYQRGGLVRFFNRDLYPFFRLSRTRMWREFDLLVQLQALGLPAPVAVAAHCRQVAPGWCRGDLITLTIPDSRTLAQALQVESLSRGQWQNLGEMLARFHSRGVFHADLNANNILLDQEGRFYLLDFDKGDLRAPARDWQEANLARLLRSLRKLQGRYSCFYFQPADWSALLDAYRAGGSS
jgi:3-deoxy-D-manno-octulosonic acid kinase